METFLFKTETGYFRTTPGGRYGRFDATKSAAMPLCKDCLNSYQKLFQDLHIDYDFEFHEALEQCPNCKKYSHLTTRSTTELANACPSCGKPKGQCVDWCPRKWTIDERGIGQAETSHSG